MARESRKGEGDREKGRGVAWRRGRERGEQRGPCVSVVSAVLRLGRVITVVSVSANSQSSRRTSHIKDCDGRKGRKAEVSNILPQSEELGRRSAGARQDGLQGHASGGVRACAWGGREG